jgi:hypothetical protein
MTRIIKLTGEQKRMRSIRRKAIIASGMLGIAALFKAAIDDYMAESAGNKLATLYDRNNNILTLFKAAQRRLCAPLDKTKGVVI